MRMSLDKYTQYLYDKNDLWAHQFVEYCFDKDGNKAAMTVFYKEKISQARRVVHYNKNGDITGSEMYDIDGALNSAIRQVYDTNYNRVKQEALDKDQTLKTCYYSKYLQTDATGNWQKKAYWDSDVFELTLETRIVEYYP